MRNAVSLLLLVFLNVAGDPVELRTYQKQGYIITNEGEKIVGVIELNAWGVLWMNQSKIGFCSQEQIDENLKKGKNKFKVKWNSSKNIKGYGYDKKEFETKTVRLHGRKSLRMVEKVGQGAYKFYNSSEERPTPVNDYRLISENSEGVLE